MSINTLPEITWDLLTNKSATGLAKPLALTLSIKTICAKPTKYCIAASVGMADIILESGDKSSTIQYSAQVVLLHHKRSGKPNVRKCWDYEFKLNSRFPNPSVGLLGGTVNRSLITYLLTDGNMRGYAVPFLAPDTSAVI